MNRRALVTLFVGGLFLIAGCSPAKASSIVKPSTPAPTATPTLLPIVAASPLPPQGTTVDQLTSQCTLLNSRDLSGLFTPATSEKIGPMHTFENGNAYVTIGIIDTSLNLATPADVNQLITMEKQLALHAQSSLSSVNQ